MRRRFLRFTVPEALPAVASTFVGGGALSFGVAGIVRGGRDVWFGVALVLLAGGLMWVTASWPRSSLWDVAPLTRGQRLTEAVAALSVTTVILAVFVGIDISTVGQRFTSGYDALDPHLSHCDRSAVPMAPRYTLRDGRGQAVGTAQIVRSVTCSSAWLEFELTPAAATQMRGESAHITTRRPADGETTHDLLNLSGHHRPGWGRDARSCALHRGQPLHPGSDAGAHGQAGDPLPVIRARREFLRRTLSAVSGRCP